MLPDGLRQSNDADMVFSSGTVATVVALSGAATTP